jgi:hypothetical protein
MAEEPAKLMKQPATVPPEVKVKLTAELVALDLLEAALIFENSYPKGMFDEIDYV